ncbi:MAG: L,D-transpeptidase family protein [Chitinophagales bacterium]
MSLKTVAVIFCFVTALISSSCGNTPALKNRVANSDSTRKALLDSFSKVEVKEVDSLVVFKSERLLYVFNQGKLLKIYRVCLGSSPVGDKQCQGDGKTPEGLYFINDRNPNSSYHKNLGISYPNDADRQEARAMGKSPGGDIKLHGLPNSYNGGPVTYDWTDGCISVSNEEIDELYAAVKTGSPILIKP